MRKFLCVVLALIISSIALFSYAENVDELQTKSNEIKNQINQSNEKLDDVKNELSANLQQVQKLDETIENAEKQLNELNTKIENLQKNIDQIQEKLNKVQKEYDKQKKMLEERLVSIYEEGDVQYIDVLLSSTSLSDFLSNYYLITELATYDTHLLNEVETQKNIIEEQNKKLSEQKEQMAENKQTQLKTSKVLQNNKTLREHYISQLSEQEQKIQGDIDEYNKQYKEIEAEILMLSKNVISEEYIGGIMAWPIPGYTRITSQYGMRTHPITGVYKLHTGVDVGAPIGANFIAANDGVVTKASYNGAYGNMVIIDHGGGVSTLYAHGSEIVVQAGQQVKKGDVVLKVGSTGYSTGAHAHFEVRINGQPVNPMDYITSTNKKTTDSTLSQENNTIENNTVNN